MLFFDESKILWWKYRIKKIFQQILRVISMKSTPKEDKLSDERKRRYSKLRQHMVAGILIIIPVFLFIFSGEIEKNLFRYIWEKNHTGKLISYKRTKYQTVVLEKYGQQITAYGDGMILYSFPDSYASRGIFHLIQSLKKSKAGNLLIFGTGPGSIL